MKDDRAKSATYEILSVSQNVYTRGRSTSGFSQASTDLSGGLLADEGEIAVEQAHGIGVKGGAEAEEEEEEEEEVKF